MKQGCLQFGLLLLAFIGLFAGSFWYKTRPLPINPARVSGRLSCYALGEEFIRDSLAADRRYRGRTLELEGLLAGFTDDDIERDRQGQWVWMWDRSHDYVALVGAQRRDGLLRVQAPLRWPTLNAPTGRFDSLLRARGQALHSVAERPYVLVQAQLQSGELESRFPVPGLPRYTSLDADALLGRGPRSQLLTHRLRLRARYCGYQHRSDSTLVLRFDLADSVFSSVMH